jgi:hypothetical protein
VFDHGRDRDLRFEVRMVWIVDVSKREPSRLRLPISEAVCVDETRLISSVLLLSKIRNEKSHNRHCCSSSVHPLSSCIRFDEH